MPAPAAPLRGVCRTDSLDPAGSFVLQSSDQQAPTGSHDLPVESGLLAHAATGFGLRALRRTGHIGDPQVLKADHIEAPSKISRDLLAPVLAGVSLPSFQPCNREFPGRAASRSVLRPRQLALEQGESPLSARAKPRRIPQFASGQRGAHDHAPVDTHDLAVAGCGDDWRDGGESNMPATRPIASDPVGPRRRDGPGPAEPYPSSFRHAHRAGVARQAPDVAWPDRGNSESLILPGLPPGRPAVRTDGEAVPPRLKVWIYAPSSR